MSWFYKEEINKSNSKEFSFLIAGKIAINPSIFSILLGGKENCKELLGLLRYVEFSGTHEILKLTFKESLKKRKLIVKLR